MIPSPGPNPGPSPTPSPNVEPNQVELLEYWRSQQGLQSAASSNYVSKVKSDSPIWQQALPLSLTTLTLALALALASPSLRAPSGSRP